MRYVHHNPIEAHIYNNVEDYKWSSDIFYRKKIRSFVNIDVVLDILDTDRQEAIKKYKELIM